MMDTATNNKEADEEISNDRKEEKEDCGGGGEGGAVTLKESVDGEDHKGQVTSNKKQEVLPPATGMNEDDKLKKSQEEEAIALAKKTDNSEDNTPTSSKVGAVHAGAAEAASMKKKMAVPANLTEDLKLTKGQLVGGNKAAPSTAVADAAAPSAAADVQQQQQQQSSSPLVNMHLHAAEYAYAEAEYEKKRKAAGLNADNMPHPQDTAADAQEGPAPTSLRRQNQREIIPPPPPGALPVFPSGEFPNNNREEAPNDLERSSDPQQQEQQQTTEEFLLNATLVDEEDPEAAAQGAPASSRLSGLNENGGIDGDVVFEAQPALEGFRAIFANKRFKVMMGAFLLVVSIAIVLPLAILVPQSQQNKIPPGVIGIGIGNSTLDCGTLATKQGDYRGTINVTESGKTCQRWDSQLPHSHNYLPEQFSAGGLDENYCRNPGGDARPWCYTEELHTRWEWCRIPYCDGWEMEMREDCGTMSLRQEDYRGTVSVTATGKKCQVWDSDYPHFHVRTSDRHPYAGLQDGPGNYCRNPAGYAMAMCYTMENDTEWEYCDIPTCSSRANWLYHNNTCGDNCTTAECGSESVKQNDYRGKINTTVSGLTCQRWDAQSPHRHQFTPELKPNFGLEDNNYCRNPDASAAAWCYTVGTTELRSELCSVPYCPEEFIPRRKCGTLSKSQADYRGDIKVSESGLDCLPWMDSADAVSLGYTHEDLPGEGLITNYCRNPSKDERSRAWCFVSGAENSWEYCSIQDCKECGTVSENKKDYRGTESVTINGKKCMNWKDKEQELVQLNLTTIDYYYDLEENLCRNPQGIRDDVWCFVEDPSDAAAWERCRPVPDCTDDPNMPVPTNNTCGSAVYHQTDYRGSINVTVSGRTCQPWGSQEPHTHKFTPQEHPGSGLDGNSCRNPDGPDSIGAWCYTTDTDVLWEYCAVPLCEALVPTTNATCGSLSMKQKDYRGTINVTSDGVPCQRWDSQEPHPHRFTPESRATAGLEEAYCRNPDNSDRAWCFTTDPAVLHGYCDVPVCTEKNEAM